MKVDLHVHTAEHSKCSNTAAVEMVRTARERGLDGVVITDHHYHLTEEERGALERAVPGIRVFRGIEIGIRDWNREGVNWEDLVIVCGEPWTRPDYVPAQEMSVLRDYARRTGALTVLAHPFRYHRDLVFDLRNFTPDAVEIASSNVSPSDFGRIAGMAGEFGMKVVGVTDAHSPNLVGLYYVELDYAVRTEAELAAAIRAGDYCLGTHEPTFQARVAEIQPGEDLARQVLAEGGTVETFLERGGRHEGFFKRVAEGGSYMPDRRVVGLRNSADQ